MRRFGLKAGIDFAHSGLEWGMVFKGTTGLYEPNCFDFKWENRFCCCSHLVSNDDIIFKGQF